MAEEGSERELEEFLAESGVFGEAKTPPEDEVEVVHDVPPGQEPDEAPPPSPDPEPVEEEGEEEEAEEEGEPHLVWARKKYGAEPEAWAKAAYNQERFISQLNTEKKQAEEIAQQAIQYAQQVEAQSQVQSSMTMPLSSQEEAWVEQSQMNPGAYAYQAAREGNVQLYNAVLENVAMENPSLAAQLGTQVQMALQDEMRQAQAEAAQHQAANQNGQPDFNSDLGQSFQRVGVDVKKYGEAMWEKFEELGQYHPYTLAVLGGEPLQRDLAVNAVYDLVRQNATTTRRIGDETREEQIRREGELRRGAASVVTGSPHVEPKKETPFMEGMIAEWKRRGQWAEEE